MKKMMKRTISLMLTVVLAAGVTGCGKGGSNSQDEAAKTLAAKQNVYKAEKLNGNEILLENENIMCSKLIDGKLYIIGNKYYSDEMQGSKMDLIQMNTDGTNVTRSTILDMRTPNPYYNNDGGMDYEEGGDIEIMPYTEDSMIPKEEEEEPAAGEEEIVTGEVVQDPNKKYTEDGYEIFENSWANQVSLGKSEVAVVVESNAYYNDADGNYNPLSNSLEIKIIDFNGNEKNTIVINEDQNMNYMYVNNMDINEDGIIAVCTEQKIFMYDTNGKKLLENDVDSSKGWISSFFFDKSGVLCYVRYDHSGETPKVDLTKVDPKTNKTEEGLSFSVDLSNYSIQSGNKYDLFLTNNIGAFGFNWTDAAPTPILNYINSDIDNSNVNNLIEVDDTHILMVANAENWQDPQEVYLCTYVNPEDIQDKKVITLGCNWLDYNVKKRIVQYNKENENYRITVTDYSQYSTVEDYNAGNTKLNNDIIAGKMPDILMVDSYSMSIDSYIAKGLIADIKKLIEEDPELNYEDYFENVFNACSVDGKLYQLVANFDVQTVAGKTSIVGDKEGWTMEDLKALMAKYPDASVFGTTMARDSILWMTLMYSGSQYVDTKAGKCYFDSDEFVALLEFMKQFPKEFNYDDLPENWWMEQQNAYREDKTLLCSVNLSNAENYIQNVKGQFGEPVTLIGFPAKEGIGAVINPGLSFAISAKSKNIDGAWDFLRYYLTKDFQSSDENDWYLPVMKSEALKRLEKGMERPYWEDENGNKEYYDYTYWNGVTEEKIDPLTREEVDKLFDYISKVDKKYYSDEALSKIITEEAEAFFAGQKSAKDVAGIIQSRAQLYINESR